MNARRRALAIELVNACCKGECSGDALLCVTHQQIEAAIQDAVREALTEKTETRA